MGTVESKWDVENISEIIETENLVGSVLGLLKFQSLWTYRGKEPIS